MSATSDLPRRQRPATPVRRIQTAHDAAARALLARELEGSPYLERCLEALDIACHGDDPEYRAQAAFTGDEMHGVGVYGWVAGAIGTARLFAVAATDDAAAHDVLDSILEELRAARARLLFAELPDERPTARMSSRLRDHGFTKVGTIPDLVRDGVSMEFYRYDLRAG